MRQMQQEYAEKPSRFARLQVGKHISYLQLLLLPLLHLISTLMWGRCTMTYPPCRKDVHFISRQSLLFDSIPHPVQAPSLRTSRLPYPLYFHLHRLPSYVVLLSYYHTPIPLQPPFLQRLLLSIPIKITHFVVKVYTILLFVVMVVWSRGNRPTSSTCRS